MFKALGAQGIFKFSLPLAPLPSPPLLSISSPPSLSLCCSAFLCILIYSLFNQVITSFSSTLSFLVPPNFGLHMTLFHH